MSIIKGGMVVIDKNKILQVGKAEDLKNQYSADEIIDCGNSIVMPDLLLKMISSYFNKFFSDYKIKKGHP